MDCGGYIPSSPERLNDFNVKASLKRMTNPPVVLTVDWRQARLHPIGLAGVSGKQESI